MNAVRSLGQRWERAPLLKIVVLPGLLAGYAAAFYPLYDWLGPIIGAFSMALCALGGLSLGVSGGAAYSVLAFAVTALLYDPVETNTPPIVITALASSLAFGLGGGLVRRWGLSIVARKRELQDAKEALERAQQQLVEQARLATIGELAAGIGHELNQPLTIISMAAGDAATLLEKGRAHEVPGNLEIIREQVFRAGRIIFQLRSAGGEGRAGTHRHHDVPALVDEALHRTAHEMRAHDIAVHVRGGDGLPRTWCDGFAIGQALTNLLLNAKDALHGTPLPRVELKLEPMPGGVRIVLDDNGPGIPQPLRCRIFDPFFSTREVGRGMGLGLSICRRIVRDHGGTITVADSPLGGARFVVELPHDPPRDAPAAPPGLPHHQARVTAPAAGTIMPEPHKDA